jgi:prepilin-type N-terminal cleavage/methylation domain-containing protein
MNRSRAGFTLVEIVITTTVLVIVASIATPYYLKYREASCKSACVTNMVKIESAVMMAKMAGISSPNEPELIGPRCYLKKMPTCPTNLAPYTKFDPPECPAGDPTHVISPSET